jgi:hypothetical protein
VYGRGYQGGVSFGPTVTPPIVKQLLIANAAVFFAQILSQGWLGYDLFSALGAIAPREFFSGRICRPSRTCSCTAASATSR